MNWEKVIADLDDTAKTLQTSMMKDALKGKMEEVQAMSAAILVVIAFKSAFEAGLEK